MRVYLCVYLVLNLTYLHDDQCEVVCSIAKVSVVMRDLLDGLTTRQLKLMNEVTIQVFH